METYHLSPLSTRLHYTEGARDLIKARNDHTQFEQIRSKKSNFHIFDAAVIISLSPKCVHM